jgi:hypothetical protein
LSFACYRSDLTGLYQRGVRPLAKTTVYATSFSRGPNRAEKHAKNPSKNNRFGFIVLCDGVSFRVREEPRYAFAACSEVKRDRLADQPLISIFGFAFFPIGADPTLKCFSRSVDSCFLDFSAVATMTANPSANTPSAGLTSDQTDNNIPLDRFEIEDETWRKVTWCRRWLASEPRLPV